jgi:putative redox protein
MQFNQVARPRPVSPVSMEMNVRFPQGLSVEASFGRFQVLTDQPTALGGAGAAPSPFDLFLASIGTCAGYYAMRFCQARGLPTDDLVLRLKADRDPDTRRYPRISMTIELPPEFPEKYRAAIVSAAQGCSVKKHLVEPPEIEISTVREQMPPSRPVAASSLRA